MDKYASAFSGSLDEEQLDNIMTNKIATDSRTGNLQAGFT
jgi:hypothetical protein